MSSCSVCLVIFLLIFWLSLCYAHENKELKTVDVEKLSDTIYGTELLLLDNSYQQQTAYKFEDFFWTGSGDGSNDEENWNTENPSTIYKTVTILIDSPQTTTLYNGSTDRSSKCTKNCVPTSIPDGDITPTPVFKDDENNSDEDDEFFNADRQFWLLTVLKSDGKDPVIIDLKNSLAKLYKTAFQRQQDRHLGINNRVKRKVIDKPVKVYIHNVDKTKLNGDQKITVLYHVAVAGKPVYAVTAAEDMTLVSDQEVREELGYPFLIKAEPYIKEASNPQAISRAHNTWIVIGSSIIGLLIFLLFLAFIILAIVKRKRIPSATTGVENRQHIFERGVLPGQENKGYQDDSLRRNENSPTYIDFKNKKSRLDQFGQLSQSSLSSTTSSTTSLDISPLMGLSKKTPPSKPPRPKAAINKTNMKKIRPELFDSDSGSERNRDSPDTIFVGNYDPGVVSPKSYLSMPSVKSFPRGSMPEPLNKVLEPVSMLHLDMPDSNDEKNVEKEERKYSQMFHRYGSVGATEDPGVIGPVVWNMHCKRLQHGVSVDEGIDDIKTTGNITKMRKRFHDLLDDTFSLFGSRRESPVEDQKVTPIEVKSHSAMTNRSNEVVAPKPMPRPKTTDLRRITRTPGSSTPKGAWSSEAPSPLVRPLSAGIINHPKINVDHVLSDGKFKENDPAVPLIEAIKKEIKKCSLPGSTTDLRE